MIALVALLVVGSASAGEGARRPTACAMLAAGVEASSAFKYKTGPLALGNNALSCTRTDGKPLTEVEWRASLSFYPYPPAKPSIAGAKQAWKQAYTASRRKGEEPERLRGFGADDAYGYESERPTASPPVRTSGIFWRKGVYLGELLIGAPLSSNRGDLEDASDILKASLRLLPRS